MRWRAAAPANVVHQVGGHQVVAGHGNILKQAKFTVQIVDGEHGWPRDGFVAVRSNRAGLRTQGVCGCIVLQSECAGGQVDRRCRVVVQLDERTWAKFRNYQILAPAPVGNWREGRTSWCGVGWRIDGGIRKAIDCDGIDLRGIGRIFTCAYFIIREAQMTEVVGCAGVVAWTGTVRATGKRAIRLGRFKTAHQQHDRACGHIANPKLHRSIM